MNMKTMMVILMAQGLFYSSTLAGPVMVREGHAVGKIVLDKNASASEQWAATELANHFKQMSGAEVEIVTAPDPLPDTAIILGDGEVAKSMGVETNPEALGTDGYVLKTVGNRLVIAGGKIRGTLYGTYEVLAQLGCRWWYPGESTIPTRKTITLPVLDVVEVPTLDYRDLLYGETSRDSDEAMLWRARNRMNGGMFKTQKEKYGGQVSHKRFTHSYWDLVPPKKYFGAHPEYFGIREKTGKRATRQPCFSSPEMVQLMAEATIKAYEEHPDWLHHTIGQEDNYDHCVCEGCKALVEKYGGSGAQLDFANRIAQIVRKTHPDIPLNVPAYTWTRTPPKGGIKPGEKMSISLSNIECSFARPIVDKTPDWNADWSKDLEGWSKLTDRLNIWTYSTSFRHYLVPFPNYYTTGPNLRLYAKNNVKGVMAQGSHTTVNGAFAALDIWLWSRLMWNPEQDERALVKEFTDGYYGPAGEHILGYLNDLHTAMLETGSELYIRMNKATGPVYPLFTPALVERTERHFAQAVEAMVFSFSGTLGNADLKSRFL